MDRKDLARKRLALGFISQNGDHSIICMHASSRNLTSLSSRIVSRGWALTIALLLHDSQRRSTSSAESEADKFKFKTDSRKSTSHIGTNEYGVRSEQTAPPPGRKQPQQPPSHKPRTITRI
eukprot:scaffold8631_cov145-Skeletonema_menzelii.AAC.13